MFSISLRDCPTQSQALIYEIHGSWWAGLIPGKSWAGSLVGKYFTWKVKRKYHRVEESIKFERRMRILHPDWWKD
jgi:hypothetical protein